MTVDPDETLAKTTLATTGDRRAAIEHAESAAEALTSEETMDAQRALEVERWLSAHRADGR